MTDDEDPDGTGAKPIAHDGEPRDDLAARRKRSGKGRRNGGTTDGGAGSIAARGEQAQIDGAGVGEEDDGQFFVWEQGRRVSLGTLIKAGVDTENVFVFSGKRVKGRGGLMALDEQPLMLVRGVSAGVRVVPTHDDHDRVKKAVVEQHVATQIVLPIGTEDAVAMLRPALEKMGLAIVPIADASAG